MADNPSEIPLTMHELAERNLKQAQAAYEQFTAYVTSAMGTLTSAAPSAPMAGGLKDVQDRAMEMAKENAESAFTFAREISKAKTPQEVLALQTQFAQDRMKALVTQAQDSTDRSKQKP